MKKFLITIDTEGDNLWEYKQGETIHTENALYLPRFQRLCDKYEFKPVYLTNYEMAKDSRFVEFAKRTQNEGRCEIGMHLHAWNTPPQYDLPQVLSGLPYLVEYPESIMREKICTMDSLLTETFGTKSVTHRAGRWAVNQAYLNALIDSGYKVDCSVTPHINWHSSVGQIANSFGPDYSATPERPYTIRSTSRDGSILEVPVSIGIQHLFNWKKPIRLKKSYRELKQFLRGTPVWIRPNGKNLRHMLRFAAHVAASDAPYLMFVIHSSELMPGGSPTFRTIDSIETLYANLEELFETVSRDYEGCTIRNFIV